MQQDFEFLAIELREATGTIITADELRRMNLEAKSWNNGTLNLTTDGWEMVNGYVADGGTFTSVETLIKWNSQLAAKVASHA